MAAAPCLTALIAIGAVVAALVWDSGGGVFSLHHSSAGGGSGARVPLAAVTAYDPFGYRPARRTTPRRRGRPTATRARYWQTESYRATFAAIGKQGVGLVLAAKEPVQLRKVEIVTTTPGFTAVIRAGDSQGPFPDTVSASQIVSSGTQFTISGGKHPYYLIWITSLPPGGSTVRINEVKAT